jgi:hypothetical protein
MGTHLRNPAAAKCEFDLLTRRALGLVNLDEKLPSLHSFLYFPIKGILIIIEIR